MGDVSSLQLVKTRMAKSVLDAGSAEPSTALAQGRDRTRKHDGVSTGLPDRSIMRATAGI